MKYLIERSNDNGRTVQFWKRALGNPWTNNPDDAETMGLEEAQQFRDDLEDHNNQRGSGYQFYMPEARTRSVDGTLSDSPTAKELQAVAQMQVAIWTERLNRIDQLIQETANPNADAQKRWNE